MALSTWRLWRVESDVAPVLLHALEGPRSEQRWLLSCGAEKYVLTLDEGAAGQVQRPGWQDLVYSGEDYWITRHRQEDVELEV